MFSNKKIIFIILLLLMLSIAGCAEFPGCDAAREKSDKKTQEKKEIPKEIKELEAAVLTIMHQANLIPLVESESQNSGSGSGTEGQGASEMEEEGQNQDVKLTFEKTILGEVLKREMEAVENNKSEQIPGDTENIWDNIKTTVTELHNQWNEFEPMVVQENMYPDTIESFEETLESLTIAITEHNYSSTLNYANGLTEYLSKFMTPFSDTTAPMVNELKYHVRNILLNAAIDDYEEAQGSLNYMKEHSQFITSTLKESKKKFESLNTSLDNLQGALNEQNLGLINIKAAIVMEELIRIMEELE